MEVKFGLETKKSNNAWFKLKETSVVYLQRKKATIFGEYKSMTNSMIGYWNWVRWDNVEEVFIAIKNLGKILIELRLHVQG